MPKTALTPISILGPYPTLPVSATTLDLTFTAADVVNGNSFPSTGKEVLLVQNSDTNPHTFTITSYPTDVTKRTGDVTAYSVAAGKIAAFSFNQTAGWKQLDGSIYLVASDVTMKYAVVRLP